MCQILCVTAHDPAKRDEIIQNAWNTMKFSQKDGYGAAWFGINGEIGFYKRRLAYIKNPISFNLPEFIQRKTTNIIDFQSENNIPSDGGFLIIHGRISTNEIKLENTHPMLTEDGKTALIHNGTVSSYNYDNLDNCSCDSELLMQAYVKGGIEEINENIQGRFAFMALRLEEELKTLHVAKDFFQPLFGGKLPDGYAFATNDNLLTNVKAEILGEFVDNQLLIFDGPENYKRVIFIPKPYKYVSEYERNKRTYHYPDHSHYKPPVQHLLNDDSERLQNEKEQQEIEDQEKEMIENNWRGSV